LVGHAVNALCQRGVGALSKPESQGGKGRARSEFIAAMQTKSPEQVGAFFAFLEAEAGIEPAYTALQAAA
jgi:hypothetical protein